MALFERIQSIIPYIVRALSLIVGFISLSLSSFAAKQFHETPRWKVLAVSTIVIALVSAFVLIPRIYDQILANTNRMHFSLKAIVIICFLAFASTVIFLTKYPGFKTHNSEYNSTTSFSTTGESIRGYQFNLYSAGAFAFLALIVSWERQLQNMEFGLFNFLLELTMDVSMDIPSQNWRGPSLWYMLAAGLYCCLLIFIRSYRDSLIQTEENNPAAVEPEQQDIEMAMNLIIPTSPKTSFGGASISTTHEDGDDDNATSPLETISVGGTNSIILYPGSFSEKDTGVQTDLPPGTSSIQEETVIVEEHDGVMKVQI